MLQNIQTSPVIHFELRLKRNTLAFEQFCDLCVVGDLSVLRIERDQAEPTVILATTACSSCHLQVLTRCYGSHLRAIKLLELGKQHTPCRQIEPDSEGRRCKDDFKVAIGEQNLNNLLQYLKKACMVNTDAADEEGSEGFDLRQVSVFFIQALKLLLDKFHDYAFGVAVSERDHWLQTFGKLQTSSSRKCKDDYWQQLHLLDVQQRFLKVRELPFCSIRAFLGLVGLSLGMRYNFLDCAFFGHDCLFFKVNLLVLVVIFDHLLQLFRLLVLHLLFLVSALVLRVVKVHFSVVGNSFQVVAVDILTMSLQKSHLAVD